MKTYNLNPNTDTHTATTPKILIKSGIFDESLTNIAGYNVALILASKEQFVRMFRLRSDSKLNPPDLHYSLKYHEGGELAVISYGANLYLFSNSEGTLSDEFLEGVLADIKSQPTLADSTGIPPELGFTKEVQSDEEKLEGEIELIDRQILRLQRRLVGKVSAMREKQAELIIAQGQEDKELEVIITHEKVESYSVIRNKLYIKFKEIVATVEEVDYPGYIGRVMAVVNIQSLLPGTIEPEILFYNLDRVELGYDGRTVPHPHVITGPRAGVQTVACLGNYLDPLSCAVVDREFEMLAELLYRLLSTVNLEEQDEAARFFPAWKNKVYYTKQNDLWKTGGEDE